jgi:branched-chain amino acid transport system substrate-binding protein
MGPVEGWVSGKLVERAAAALTADRPTSAQLLAGLWTVKNDTLGGLTSPLTFTANQPATPTSCGFLITIKAGTWISPDSAMRCY